MRPYAALFLALAVAPAARAEPNPLDLNPRWSLGVTLGGAVLAMGVASSTAPSRCRWCATNTNSVDSSSRRELSWRRDADAASVTSDVLANGVLPAAALAHSGLAAWSAGSPRAAAEDTIVMAEAVVLATNLNVISKNFIARRRPCAGGGASGAAAKSFYSGHTSLAFSVATSAATVSTLRGYPSAPWVWAAGLTLATGVGYLRIAGDHHWATDVAVGAFVGGLVGWAVPWTLHRVKPRRSRDAVEVVPAPGGLALVF